MQRRFRPTIAKRMVQSSHHTFFVIRILTDHRRATMIAVNELITHVVMTIPSPLLMSPSGGDPFEAIKRKNGCYRGLNLVFVF